jgi:Fe-S cluster assembly protein SufD
VIQPLSSWSEAAWKSLQQQILVPPSLQDWRLLQLNEFLKRGFPTSREENWRYTPITSLLEQSFDAELSKNTDASLDLSPYWIPQSHRLVFINGRFSEAHSELKELDKKVILTTTSVAANEFSEYYQQMNAINLPAHLSVFHWLNGAIMKEGLFLRAMQGAQIKKPVHLLYVNYRGKDQGNMHHPRHLVQLEEGSRLSLIEEYVDLDSQTHFNNVVTKIKLKANACLNYYKLQRQNKFSFHIANTEVEQQGDSRFNAYHIASGSQLNREDLHIALQESGAECDLSGFYYPQSQQLIDFHTRIDHFHAHTCSRQYYKGMVEELGCGVFNGKIIVHPQAQKIIAQQQNHNLLLAKSAEINTKPELEVYADNVQCSHGASVGRIDPQALFYLRSRGLTEAEALQMLKIGFCREIFERLPDHAIAHYIQSAQGVTSHV